MKKQEWIGIPLLGFAVSFIAMLMKLMATGNCSFAEAWKLAATPLGWGDTATLAAVFIIIPGIITLLFFRKYPERVRLSPFSFGMIVLIPLSLLPFLPLAAVFVAGNGIIVVATLVLPLFKPGARLGEFERIPFRKTVLPALLAALPLLMILPALFRK